MFQLSGFKGGQALQQGPPSANAAPLCDYESREFQVEGSKRKVTSLRPKSQK